MQFLKANTIAEGQHNANVLEQSAKLLGHTLSRDEALTHVARANGYGSWSEFESEEVRRVDALLVDSELVSVRSCGAHNSYGPEQVIPVKTGFAVRFGCEDGATLEHARVTDPLGREVVYYTADEILESPLEVVSALLRYASRGAVAGDAEPTGPAQQACSLIDLSSVMVDGRWFKAQWSCPDDELADVSETDVVLTVNDEEDGLEFEENFELGQLRAMRWDEQLGCFIAPNGQQLQFFRSTEVLALKL